MDNKKMMPTLNTRTERDEFQQFYFDASARPKHAGEWRHIGDWDEEGKLVLHPVGEPAGFFAYQPGAHPTFFKTMDALKAGTSRWYPKMERFEPLYLAATPSRAPAAVSEPRRQYADLCIPGAPYAAAMAAAQPAVAPSDSAKTAGEMVDLIEDLEELASDLHYEGNCEMSQEKQSRAALINRGVQALRQHALAAAPTPDAAPSAYYDEPADLSLSDVAPEAGKPVALPSVDELAQQIRWLNGSNKMGAGTLAEKILEWLGSRNPSAADGARETGAQVISDALIVNVYRDHGILLDAWEVKGYVEIARAILELRAQPPVDGAQAAGQEAGPLYSTRLNAKRYLHVRKHGIPFSRDVDYTDAQIDYLVDKAMGLPVGAFPAAGQEDAS